MADTTIDIEGMNDQMARTDSLVARLAQDVDRLTESFSNFSKSANVEKMLGTINTAFDTMRNEVTNTSKNVKSGVSSIINDITTLAQTAGKSKSVIGKGINLDFVSGNNLSERQKLFNASILQTAANYEILREKVKGLQNELRALYADTTAEERKNDPTYKELKKMYEKDMASSIKEMKKDEDAYLAVLNKVLETENLLKKARQEEKVATSDLTALNKQLLELKQKRAEIWSNVSIRGDEAFGKEEDALVTAYNKKIKEIEKSISALSKKYPELAKSIKETFNIKELENTIKLRDKENAILNKQIEAENKKAEAERKKDETERIRERTEAAREMQRIYKDILTLQENISKLTAQKKTGLFGEEERHLLRLYEEDLTKLQHRIDTLSNDYPLLGDRIRSTFFNDFIKQEIKDRDRQRDAISKVTKELDKQVEAQNRIAGAEAQRMLYEKRTTVGGALDYSAKVKNEIQAKQAIEYLTAARQKLDKTDVNYEKDLKRLNAEIQRHQQFLRNAGGETTRLQTRTFSLLQSTKQLAEGFGIMFSVYGISNFIRKLVQVTGEFELQQTALKSIIQSGDKAQTMFMELQKMAVASPYSIQQLVSYNKQLAAYRVETDKLLPVLKQLGDVASGVGVDMQRLILAYGQVKAANYLRGQELRQFSEAGINILGELARRFSDAEGKVVSTGEVFDRVSKRLVKFEDVAAVFDDLTKKGGIFYDMQAKQAETVRGQLMNLKDAFQISLYEIGQETNGSIRTFLSLLRWVAKDLTTIVKLGATALGLFIAWKTNLAIAEMHAKRIKLGFGEMAAQSFPKISNFFSSIKGHPMAAAVSVLSVALTEIIVKIIKIRQRINELKKESVEAFSAMTESVKELNDAILKSGDYEIFNDKGKARFKLVSTDNLKNDLRVVQNFIDDLEKQGIELKPGFDLEYSEKDKDELAEKLADFMNNVQDRASELIKSFEEGKESAAKTILGIGVKDNIKRASKDIEKFKELIRKNSIAIGDEITKYGTEIGMSVDQINEANAALKRLRDEDYASVSEAYSLWKGVSVVYKEIAKTQGVHLQTAGKFERITRKISTTIRDIDFAYDDGSMIKTFDALFEKFKKAEGFKDDFLKNLFAENDPDKVQTIVNKFLQFTKGAFQESGKQFTEDVWNDLLYWFIQNQNHNPFVIEPLFKKPSGSILEDNRTDWQRVYNNFVDELNKNEAKFTKAIDKIDVAEYETTKQEQIDALTKRYDELQGYIKGYNAESKEQQELDKDKYHKWIDEAAAVDEARRSIGYYDKKSKKSAKDRSSEFEKMVKFIRQLRSEYEKLNKTFPGEDAAKRVADSFRDEFEDFPKYFRDLFGDDINNIPFMTPEGTSAALKNVKDSKIIEKFFAAWQKKLQIFLDKNIAEEQVEIAVDLQKKSADEINRQIEELFSNYEIQLQLTELGLTTDEAKDIFNLDAIDLAELGKKLGEYRDEILENFGKDELAKYEEYQKKYTEIYEKAQMERMKKYSAYLQKEMSERVKVEMETLKQLAELDSIPALYSNDEDSAKYKARERIRNKILEDRDKKIDAIIWKEFQQTDFYVSLFTDLGNASYQSLGMMKERLEELRGSLKNLSASDLKAVSENLQRIDDQLLQDNPFDALITAANDFKKMRKDIEKDGTLEKILGVDKVKNFRKGMTDALNEINKKLYEYNEYVETQEDGSEKIYKGLVGQLHLQEKLYQAAKMRDTAASELKKQDIGFGEEWFVPQAALDAQKKNVQMYADMIAKETDANEIEELKKKQAAMQLVVDTLEKYIKATKDLGDKSGQTSEKLGEDYDKTKKDVEDLMNTYTNLTEAQAKAIIKMRGAAAALRVVAEAVSKIQSLYETWIENIDYLGGETTDLTEAQAKLGKAIFDNLRNILDLTARILDAIPDITAGFTQAGVAINSAMGIIGLIAEAIQLVITLVSAIYKFKDDVIASNIKSIQRKVDTLAKSYEALSEAFSSAFDQDRLREYNKLMVNSLEQQKAFLEQELALEQDKKKKDRDAINDLSDRIDDINKQLAETSQKLYEELGGFGSDSAYKDAATQFVEAWYNAFTETGSGLSGLEDKFDEFFVSMLKKQLMQKVADKYFNDLLSEFDELLNRGDIWENDYMWTEYMNRVPERLQAANDVLAGLYSSLQGLFGAGGIGGLSNLQQGIQGVTESTAEILAAYLNSIRLYIAQDNQSMTSLVNWLGVGSTNDSLMSNIRLTAQNTAAINTLLQSLVPNIAHNLGGSGIKVFVS